MAHRVASIFLAIIAATSAISRGQAPVAELKNPQFWLSLAARDAQREPPNDPFFPLGPIDDVGVGQARAGDMAGAVATAQFLRSAAQAARSPIIRAMDRLAAISILISAHKPDLASLQLAALEREANEAMGPPNRIRFLAADNADPNWELNNVASQWARLGQIDRAIQCAERIDVRTDRALALCHLGATLVEMGNNAAARKAGASAVGLAAQVPKEEQSMVYAAIAEGFTKAGDVERALSAADLIVVPLDHLHALSDIVQHLVENGKAADADITIARAWKWIDARAAEERLSDYDDLATMNMEAGDAPRALLTLRRAESLAAAAPPAAAREHYLKNAALFARGGDVVRVNAALAAANAIRSPPLEKSQAEWEYSAVIGGYARAGRCDEALGLIVHCDEFYRAYAYEHIIEGLAAIGQFDRAVALMKKIDDNHTASGEAAHAIAVAWVRIADPQPLYKWTQSLSTAEVRVQAELGAAQTLLNLDSFPLYLETPTLGFVIGIGPGK